mmetsp:Transcript_3370/g.5532  ORF Transcript_3370/g.5532 Transcript_3370/m.5532 type:complete len:125 (+) Transcript_3370:298-672(+)
MEEATRPTVKIATSRCPAPVGTATCENGRAKRTFSQPKRTTTSKEVMVITATNKTGQLTAKEDDETMQLLLLMRPIPVGLEHPDVAFVSPARTTMVTRLLAIVTRSTANVGTRIDAPLGRVTMG